MTRCRFCHRPLTDAESQQAGAGEVCRKKHGIVLARPAKLTISKSTVWRSRGRSTKVTVEQFHLPFDETSTSFHQEKGTNMQEPVQLELLEDCQMQPRPAIPAGFYTGRPRPDARSAEVSAMVANDLMKGIVQWGKFAEDDISEVTAQVLAVLNESDGYRMAKALERSFSWDPDSELVDILDGVNFYSAIRTAVMAWIRDNGITPQFGIGRQVEVITNPRLDTRHTGEIVQVCEDGNYLVMIPGLGHVREGLGTHGLIFSWEDVEKWNEAEPTVPHASQ